jgi:hypothetical protein
MAVVAGRGVASAFGIEPDPDRYGLLDLACRASIRFLVAAILSATEASMVGTGGKEEGPAGLYCVEDDADAEEAGAAVA